MAVSRRINGRVLGLALSGSLQARQDAESDGIASTEQDGRSEDGAFGIPSGSSKTPWRPKRVGAAKKQPHDATSKTSPSENAWSSPRRR
jgi:hypothetical protein